MKEFDVILQILQLSLIYSELITEHRVVCSLVLCALQILFVNYVAFGLFLRVVVLRRHVAQILFLRTRIHVLCCYLN